MAPFSIILVGEFCVTIYNEYAGACSHPACRTGTTDQRTFTRVKVKSRVDQAGMPSIFDEP